MSIIVHHYLPVDVQHTAVAALCPECVYASVDDVDHAPPPQNERLTKRRERDCSREPQVLRKFGVGCERLPSVPNIVAHSSTDFGKRAEASRIESVALKVQRRVTTCEAKSTGSIAHSQCSQWKCCVSHTVAATMWLVTDAGAPRTLVCSFSGVTPRRGGILLRLFDGSAGIGHYRHAERMAGEVSVIGPALLVEEELIRLWLVVAPVWVRWEGATLEVICTQGKRPYCEAQGR